MFRKLFFTSNYSFLQVILISEAMKRALSSSENSSGLKQAKLCFGAGNVLSVGKLPKQGKVKLVYSNNLMEYAIAPLQNSTWLGKIGNEFNLPYMQALFKKLDDEMKKKKVIFPPTKLIFNAFTLTPFENVRVVIIGQDPYHNDGQAHGLSFSVPLGMKQPPSLKNIFKELAKEYDNFKAPEHGSLIKWAEQGVFLLNATLTVEKNMANSHEKFGWQKFTDSVIKTISDELDGVVFLLWGNFAHKKAALVDKDKHVIIKTAHPSPFSVHKFVDCKCFTQVNDALRKMGRKEIDWANI